MHFASGRSTKGEDENIEVVRASPISSIYLHLVFFSIIVYPNMAQLNHDLTSSNSADHTSSSTSAAHHNNNYYFDVFISHRGPDVKKTLASHLYHRLLVHGLRVFLDYQELQEGDKLTSQIEGAIRSASVNIAIFSANYAESSWCMNE